MTKRSLVYGVCAAMVGLRAVFVLVAAALAIPGIAIPGSSLLEVLLLFSALVPPMFVHVLPGPVLMVTSYVMVALVVRRAWLFIARKERTPSTFTGIPKTLGYIGVWSLGLGVLAMIVTMLLRAGSGVPAGMLMIPAVVCIPWAFFLTEVLTLRKPLAGAAGAAR